MSFWGVGVFTHLQEVKQQGGGVTKFKKLHSSESLFTLHKYTKCHHEKINLVGYTRLQ